MNKFIFSLLLMAFGTFANAQVIANLDEAALIGNWSTWGYAENTNNIWPSLNNMRLAAFKFSDDGESVITVQDSGHSSHLIRFHGFIIGGTPTGRYTLHFIQQSEDDSWPFDTPQINFIIKNFDGETLTVTSYDGTHGMILKRSNAPAGVSETQLDLDTTNDKIYNLNGVEVDSPTHGIYIQGGEKILYP